MVDSTYGWNIISDDLPIGQTVKIFFNGFIHFMKFPAILVQVHFYPTPVPPSAKQWIYPFHEISPLWQLLRADMLGSGINSFLSLSVSSYL